MAYAPTYFKTPFTMIISGGTGSGKTEWLMRFLKEIDKLCNNNIRKILYCYGELNNNIILLQAIKKIGNVDVETYSGIPSQEIIQEYKQNIVGQLLLVLDDLMLNLKNIFLDLLFTRGSHNWEVSVVLVTQHLFNKELRTARNNTHYIVLMRNPSGELQVRNLASQLFPTKTKYFLEAYKNATLENFSYLLIDMHPLTKDIERLKTNIYPGETTIVYIPKT